ncbi:RHS repeat-associated core domain-containing protein [Pseudomonas cerasi]
MLSDYGNNPIREDRDDDPFSQTLWHYDGAGRLLAQEGAQPGNEWWRWDGAGNPLDRPASEKVVHNRLTQLNGIRWQYDVHGRTTEKDNAQVRWRYRCDGEHRLSEVLTGPRDRNKPRTKVSFRYDPLGRRINKTSHQLLQGRPSGNAVTTRFVWEGYRLLQEIHDGIPLTYVFSDSQSYEPLARVDGTENPEIFWFDTAANGMPERLTDSEGRISWEGLSTLWGNLLSKSNQGVPGYDQNLRLQGQYLDRETGLHYNLFRHYDPDSARFTQQDPVGLTKCNNGKETTRVRHYTNMKGSKAIEESGTIKAYDNNRVYVEPAKNKPLSQLDAEEKYQIGRGGGRDYIETEVPSHQLEWVTNPRYHTQELTIKGDIELNDHKIFRRK